MYKDEKTKIAEPIRRAYMFDITYHPASLDVVLNLVPDVELARWGWDCAKLKTPS